MLHWYVALTKWPSTNMIMFTIARIQHDLGKIWKCFKNKTFGLQHYIKTNNNQNQNQHLLASHHHKHWTNDLQPTHDDTQKPQLPTCNNKIIIDLGFTLLRITSDNQLMEKMNWFCEN